MALQLVKIAPSGKGWIHAKPKGFKVSDFPTLIKRCPEIVATLGPDNNKNIFFTLGNHSGIESDEKMPDLPVRSKSSFLYQNILSWDVDKTDQARSFEYLAVMAQVLEIPKEAFTFISSGNGLQFHLNLKYPIRNVKYFEENKPAYNELCRKLSRAIIAAGLPLDKVDPVIFEPARVMRLPGTVNYKADKGYKDCVILQEGNFAQVEIDLQALSGMDKVKKENISPEQVKRTYPTPDFPEVIAECRFLAAMIANPSLIHEPDLFDALSFLVNMPDDKVVTVGAFNFNARQLGKYLFDGASGSDSIARQTFDDKWEQAKKYGARKCSTVNDRDPTYCRVCPHNGKIPTPLALKSKAHIGSAENGYWVLNQKGNPLRPHYADLQKLYKEENHYVTLREGPRVFTFNGSYYKPQEDIDIKSWAEDKLVPQDPIMMNHRSEFLAKVHVMGCLSASKEEYLFEKSIEGKLNCANGVLDIIKGELVPHSPEFGFKYMLPYKYIEDEGSVYFLDWLAKITQNRAELMESILDIMAYCLWPTYDDHLFVYLTGDGKNGKSTLIHIICALIGEQNYSSLSIDQVTNNRFMRAELEGKLVNLSEESSGTEGANLDYRACDTLKNLSSGGSIQVERKGEQSFKLKNKAKMIFAANYPPHFREQGPALKRRLLTIPFDYTIEDEDSRVEEILISEVPRIASMLMRRTQEIIKTHGRFKVSRGGMAASEAQKKMLLAGNTCVEFAREVLESNVTVPLDHFVDAKAVYDKYQGWCEENGHRSPMNASTFGKAMWEHVVALSVDRRQSHVKWVAGKSVRIYPRTQWK